MVFARSLGAIIYYHHYQELDGGELLIHHGEVAQLQAGVDALNKGSGLGD